MLVQHARAKTKHPSLLGSPSLRNLKYWFAERQWKRRCSAKGARQNEPNMAFGRPLSPSLEELIDWTKGEAALVHRHAGDKTKQMSLFDCCSLPLSKTTGLMDDRGSGAGSATRACADKVALVQRHARAQTKQVLLFDLCSLLLQKELVCWTTGDGACSTTCARKNSTNIAIILDPSSFSLFLK